MLYVMSDIHGRFEEFKQMLKLINFSDADTLVILGDVIDRGPDPIPLLIYILNQRNIFLLKGNHEDMMLTWAKKFAFGELNLWYNNGGYVTYEQLMKLKEKDEQEFHALIRRVYDLPTYLVIDKYIFVHAGYNGYELEDYMLELGIEDGNLDPEVYLGTLESDELLWSRDEFFEAKGITGYITIFGHTPVKSIRKNRGENINESIWYDKTFNDKIGIDGGAGHGKSLICYCTDTDSAFYVPIQPEVCKIPRCED